MRRRVDGHIVKPKALIFFVVGIELRIPAHQRVHAGRQFCQAEGLGQIVICTVLQPGNLIFFLIFGGKHQNRHVAHSPNLFQDAVSIHAGKHDVQNDQNTVTLILIEEGKRILPAQKSIYGNLLRFDTFLHQFAQCFVIVNCQNIFHRSVLSLEVRKHSHRRLLYVLYHVPGFEKISESAFSLF